ncbi:hypothetical protein [Sphingomonas rubra]|uniref:Uncharacterized protein n=1 Tax=Sphingomonas rubra TaxID=634430 RepID=A0A1I5S0N5_9SPHN|nr:hypothetical protein [Sphingomonas rubra]SFP64300.1 hypothetical protein SAMN04488241_104271 [Sphingomonas rubra]
MNAHSTIEPVDTIEWNVFKTEANLWRGRMLEHFAAVEHAVTETLIHLGAGSAGKKLPHLAGQRREALRLALASGGGSLGKPALDALVQFQREADHRAFVCHGVGRLLVDQQRQWHLYMTILAPDDTDQEVAWTISKSASEQLVRRLNASSRCVIDRLANFRNAVPAIV